MKMSSGPWRGGPELLGVQMAGGGKSSSFLTTSGSSEVEGEGRSRSAGGGGGVGARGEWHVEAWLVMVPFAQFYDFLQLLCEGTKMEDG